jgi:hypothetical protein
MTPFEQLLDLIGKTIKSVDYVPEAPQPYWVLNFDDGTEFCFVPMADLATND